MSNIMCLPNVHIYTHIHIQNVYILYMDERHIPTGNNIKVTQGMALG